MFLVRNVQLLCSFSGTKSVAGVGFCCAEKKAEEKKKHGKKLKQM